METTINIDGDAWIVYFAKEMKMRSVFQQGKKGWIKHYRIS